MHALPWREDYLSSAGDPGQDARLGAGRSGAARFTEKPVPFPGAPRCWCASTRWRSAHRPRRHRVGTAGDDPGRSALQQELDAGPRVHGHRRRSRAGRGRVRHRRRVTVEIHAGCGQCKRCRMGMYTSCLNYGLDYGEVDKGHRANGFTTDGGFAEYAVNNINTLIKIADSMSDEEATLVVTAGTAMYGLTELGGLVAGESVVVIGPGPIGLLGVAVAKALGAYPVFLTGTREARLEKGRQLGADHVVNVTKENAVEAVRRLNGGKGVDYVIECSGAADAVNEAARMSIGAARSASPPFRTSRWLSTWRTWCATTSTSTASAAKAGAPRTGPKPSCARSASTRADPHAHLRAEDCPRRCATPATVEEHQGGGQDAARCLLRQGCRRVSCLAAPDYRGRGGGSAGCRSQGRLAACGTFRGGGVPPLPGIGCPGRPELSSPWPQHIILPDGCTRLGGWCSLKAVGGGPALKSQRNRNRSCNRHDAPGRLLRRDVLDSLGLRQASRSLCHGRGRRRHLHP